MLSYLDRYLAGDYQSVWDELQALDSLVPGDLLYQDALAVAHETMRRVRHNCALLLARLDALGYTFYGDPVAYTPEWFGTPDNEYYPPRLAQPAAATAQLLAAMERDIGPLPLALRAFYEIVGAVNLVGEPPLGPDAEVDADVVEGLGAAPGWRCGVEIDPLFIYGLAMQVALCQTARQEGDAAPYRPMLFPDALLKYRRGGVGVILLDGPAATMDGTLWFEGGPMTGPSGTAWHLVEYLRFTLLHRGGFAGFGLPDAFSMLPVDEAVIRQLTQGLVSF